MATFLELCIKTARESGAVGQPPMTVEGQTGRQEKVVNWVRDAWLNVQRARMDWLFLRGEFEGQIVAGLHTYSGLTFMLDRFGGWLGERDRFRTFTIYDPTIGRKDESGLNRIQYDTWRAQYDRGVHDASRPIRYAFAHDGTLRVGPTPDKPYMIRGEYRKAPQILTADADVPDMPEHFHDIIAWEAIRLMAQHDESGAGLQMAQIKYDQVMRAMVNELLPEILLAARPIDRA